MKSYKHFFQKNAYEEPTGYYWLNYKGDFHREEGPAYVKIGESNQWRLRYSSYFTVFLK